MTEQAAFGREIEEWLARVFPELGLHPAAVAAVIRLRYVHGKGQLTRSEHGEQIHAAVRRWEAQLGDLKEAV